MTARCEGVIGIVGLPYCGSTILSYVLGSHSKIYCGADLYKLSPNYDASCSLHGEDCNLWTRENKNSVYESLENGQRMYYDRICEITKRSIVCDASKSPGYFASRVLDVGIPVLIISLRKHPLRHICSLLFNHHLVKGVGIRGDKDVEDYLSKNWDDCMDFINNSLSRVANHTVESRNLRENLINSEWLEMKYEDFVTDTKDMISEAVGFFGLRFEVGQSEFERHDLHPIVGNTGPRRKFNSSHLPVKSSTDIRASFYDSDISSIQMDEKYKLVFNNEQISKIVEIQSYRDLCDILEYPVMP
mgnify:CR=1 FL=1